MTTTKKPESTTVPVSSAIPDETRSDLARSYTSALTTLRDTLATSSNGDTITSISIHSDEEYRIAGELLTSIIKPGLSHVREELRPIVDAAWNTHRLSLAALRKESAPWEAAEAAFKAAMGRYDTARRIEQERARETAIAAARVAAEAAIHEQAAALVEEGRDGEALALFYDGGSGAPLPAEPSLPPAVYRPVQVDGVSTRTKMDFRVVDEASIGRGYLVPDMGMIRRAVDANGKEAEGMVGGIEVFQKPVIGARSR